MKLFLKKLWIGWTKFAHFIGRVNTEIVLFLFYFLIFTPLGLLFRLFGFDPLRNKFSGKSNWQKIESGDFDLKKASHQS